MLPNARFIIPLVISLFMAACSDDEDPDPVQTGGITGQVRLTDEFGNDLPDHSGMKISATAQLFGFSEAGGTYDLVNLPPGKYNLAYEKAGFGTYRRFGIDVVAGTLPTVLSGINYLGQKSTTVISGLSISYNSADSTYSISCSIAPVPSVAGPRAFRLFFGKNTGVSPGDYTYSPANTWVATTATGTITGFHRDQFYSNGFSPGETVYAVAIGESIRTNTYTDPVTQEKVFPNLNSSAPSNTVQFVLP